MHGYFRFAILLKPHQTSSRALSVRHTQPKHAQIARLRSAVFGRTSAVDDVALFLVSGKTRCTQFVQRSAVVQFKLKFNYCYILFYYFRLKQLCVSEWNENTTKLILNWDYSIALAEDISVNFCLTFVCCPYS